MSTEQRLELLSCESLYRLAVLKLSTEVATTYSSRRETTFSLFQADILGRRIRIRVNGPEVRQQRLPKAAGF